MIEPLLINPLAKIILCFSPPDILLEDSLITVPKSLYFFLTILSISHNLYISKNSLSDTFLSKLMLFRIVSVRRESF